MMCPSGLTSSCRGTRSQTELCLPLLCSPILGLVWVGQLLEPEAPHPAALFSGLDSSLKRTSAGCRLAPELWAGGE